VADGVTDGAGGSVGVDVAGTGVADGVTVWVGLGLGGSVGGLVEVAGGDGSVATAAVGAEPAVLVEAQAVSKPHMPSSNIRAETDATTRASLFQLSSVRRRALWSACAQRRFLSLRAAVYLPAPGLPVLPTQEG
jgi:hypothetical protein